MSGKATRSFTGSGKASGAMSLTALANDLKMSQSLFDSQTGGTAAPRTWINE